MDQEWQYAWTNPFDDKYLFLTSLFCPCVLYSSNVAALREYRQEKRVLDALIGEKQKEREDEKETTMLIELTNVDGPLSSSVHPTKKHHKKHKIDWNKIDRHAESNVHSTYHSKKNDKENELKEAKAIHEKQKTIKTDAIEKKKEKEEAVIKAKEEHERKKEAMRLKCLFGLYTSLYSMCCFYSACMASCILGGIIRTNVRREFEIGSGDCADNESDYVIHCFCTFCAMIQESKELTYQIFQQQNKTKALKRENNRDALLNLNPTLNSNSNPNQNQKVQIMLASNLSSPSPPLSISLAPSSLMER